MDISHIREFLHCDTPVSWLDFALEHVDTLLIDHAKCEKKAASMALSLMFKYSERENLQIKMAQLAREEVLHFEQVYEKIRERKIEYTILSPSRYANCLRKMVRAHEPDKLVDLCIIGAIIEARSCERFASLAPLLESKGENDLAKYYRYLLKSESRHYEDYLALAAEYAGYDIQARVEEFLKVEAELICEPDELFRFHSGIPTSETVI
ncbi:tRNA-(ms[2]io[6]A)-hydroxylase [Aliikangiella sp. G2MR2-5]|uniref:tRNA-(ms[2]io[6]A)-hydroxylase n=1 Tax=Aliikangiella sp. G2MR2-5 TaxID=2788943 RepID=UPI0018AAB7BF|nr:tRNA-(ms[2]io[6]A)-hydroxylase [Aliikangiella sp. G2MR2-5]